MSSNPVPVGWSSSFAKTCDALSASWPSIALKVGKNFRHPKSSLFHSLENLFQGMTSAVHPLDLSKTLIQIGFEPIPPKQTMTWLGKPALSLPSVFVYAGHIRKRDGFLGDLKIFDI